MESLFDISDLVDLLVSAAGETWVASTFQAALGAIAELARHLLLEASRLTL